MNLISGARNFLGPHLNPVLSPMVSPLRQIAETGFYRLNNTAIFSVSWSPEFLDYFSSIMKRPGPLFVGRIGGSDYELVVQHFHDPHCFASKAAYEKAVRFLMQFNGYFDIENRYENFSKFLDDFVGYYKRADCLTYCTGRLIRRFQHNRFKKSERDFLSFICAGKDLIDYRFIEFLIFFLRSFRDWGQDKIILIVSPFARSLELQYQRRNQLIKGYRFPDFQLATYNSPVTYSTPGDSKDTLRVATSNWHEECEVMASRIAGIEFDIAFLSCASYSMFLGDFIRNKLGKKAIYIGGVLNPMFNIYGPRYDCENYNGLVNLDYQIDPVENQDVEHLRRGRGVRNEGLGAYFGRRTR